MDFEQSGGIGWIEPQSLSDPLPQRLVRGVSVVESLSATMCDLHQRLAKEQRLIRIHDIGAATEVLRPQSVRVELGVIRTK